MAQTSTPRHELSPEVSADGPSIALASNWLGTMALFRMSAAGGDAEPVRIEGLEFRGRADRIRVTGVDEMDRLTATRLYVEVAGDYAGRLLGVIYYNLSGEKNLYCTP